MPAPPGPATHIERERLEALASRVRRGLACATRQERTQVLTLAEQYLDKTTPNGLPARMRAKGEALIQPLREAVGVPAPPPKFPTTVGALRDLLAGLPDSQPLVDCREWDGSWMASVAKVLALLPEPVRTAQGRARIMSFNHKGGAEDLGL